MRSTAGSHPGVLILILATALGVSGVRSAPAQTATTALFAHVATGHDANAGDYSTTFTLLNTGSSRLTGNLILTAGDGTPLTASIIGAGVQTLGSSVPITIPIGGTQFWTALGNTASDPVRTGWVRVDSAGGTLGGVATFQLVSGSNLAAIAGVLSANATQYATIPVDNDDSQKRYTGYALANRGSDSIDV